MSSRTKRTCRLPIFTTDPNEGETYGALLTIRDAQAGAFHSLLVPTLTYNSLLGAAGGIVHYEGYFDRRHPNWIRISPNRRATRLSIACAMPTPTLFDVGYLFYDFGLYENDRTARFYGIGANGLQLNETNYTLRQVGGS